MARIRLFASLLSLLSLVVAIWAWAGQSAFQVAVALLIGAICLAVVLPFDAPNPWQRSRVVLACLLYVLATTAAIVTAYIAAAPGLLMVALVLLIDCGVGLTCWAFATRNRRRMSGSKRYYDN